MFNRKRREEEEELEEEKLTRNRKDKNLN